nr:unnamed protein product [Spirometra erinaceieuropaei]
MLSDMRMDAYRDERPQIRVAYRTDGQLLNHRRVQFQSRVSTTTVHELLFADDCAPNATSEWDMQRCMDLFSATCENFGLVINTEKTVVTHQPPPNTDRSEPQIVVNGTQLQVVDNFTYLGNTLSRSSKIGDEVARRISSLRSSSKQFGFVSCHAAPLLRERSPMLRNKAPGEDGIPAEIYKSCVDSLTSRLHEVNEQAWRNEVAPDDWGLGSLVPIPKKGGKMRCGNYRGISLIDVAAKIFAIVLLRRFQAVRDSRTRPSQAGFRAGRGCADQPFGIRSGVLQSRILSPILFNYVIDWILGKALREGGGVEFAPGHRLTDLDYAEDIALLASSFGDLKSMISREKASLWIDGCQLEVDSFKYLGARLLSNGQSKDDIVCRIDAACWVFSSLRKCLWIRRDLSIATKIRVYRASVRSVLLYGCECWALRVEDERKLEVFDHHCLSTILRVKFTDFVSNETVRVRCDNIARITQAIQERRLKWFRHVLRRPPQELSVTALDPVPLSTWRRRGGGQLKTRLDTVQDMEVVLRPSVFAGEENRLNCPDLVLRIVERYSSGHHRGQLNQA